MQPRVISNVAAGTEARIDAHADEGTHVATDSRTLTAHAAARTDTTRADTATARTAIARADIERADIAPAAALAVAVRADVVRADAPAGAARPTARPSTRKVTALRQVDRWQPSGAPSIAAELWAGVHWVAQDRSDASMAELLERLAVRAQRFTPRVSLVPPDGLLLEVKGSLHLFGGVPGLRDSLMRECVALGLKPTLALAPTPLAALVSARAGQSFVVQELSQLVGQLAPLPLAALRWSQDTLERLAHMGVRTIGQVLRLPRAGFAKRFGTELLSTLDRLTGRHADLRDRFHARECFRRKIDLTYEMEKHDSILNALTALWQELGAFLQSRQCGILQLECLLIHRNAPATSCKLRLAAPSADAGRLRELLGERLNTLVLPEPVRSCELRSGELIRSTLSSNSLWQPGEHGGSVGVEAPGLIERLRARLGPEAVYSLRVLPGHRPENTWGVTEPIGGAVPGRGRKGGARASRDGAGAAGSAPPWPPFCRPLWLLSAPQLLAKRDGLPRRRGPLRLSGDPERIETGWWDGAQIERDYYVAIDIHGVHLWVFRERSAAHRWFLHGVFG